MFTKDEIQEIQRKLELSGKKLSQLPLVTEILEEDLLPILQKKENKSTTAGSYSLFVQNQILPKIEKLIEASTGEIKSSLLEVYKALLLNSEDNKNEIIEAINDLKAIVNKENKVTLTVTSDTQDARIYLNGREQSSITVEQDSIVSLVIKAEGFVTFNEVICVHRTQKIHINLSTISGPAPSVYKITVNPTPSNASVKLDGEDCFYKYAEKGTYVDVEVTLAGYRPYKQSILINADKVLNVVLQPEKICKITFDYTSFKSYPIYIYNDDNDILFTITKPNASPTVLLKEFSTLNIRVANSNYYDSRYVLDFKNTDYVCKIESVPKQYTLSINASPANSVVKLNGVVRNSIIADFYSNINVEVTLDGYKTHKETILLTQNITKNITLEYIPKQYSLVFDITPKDASVYVNNTLIDALNPYTIIEGTSYTYRIEKDYYISQSGSFTCTGNKTIVATLEKAFIPYYDNLQVLLNGQTTVNPNYNGGSYALSITATQHNEDGTTTNVSFKSVSSELTVNNLSGGILNITADSNNNYIVTVPSFSDIENRTLGFAVTIKQALGSGKDDLQYTYNIVQTGIGLTVSPSSLAFVAKPTANKQITLNTNISWSTEYPSWLTLSKTSGTPSTLTTETINVIPTEFEGNTTRTGTVTFNTSLNKASVSIAQEPQYIFKKADTLVDNIRPTEKVFTISAYFNKSYMTINVPSNMTIIEAIIYFGSNSTTLHPSANSQFNMPEVVASYIKTAKAKIVVNLGVSVNNLSTEKVYTATLAQTNDATTLNYTLTQGASQPVISVTPATIDLTSKSQTAVIKITASGNWLLQ